MVLREYIKPQLKARECYRETVYRNLWFTKGPFRLRSFKVWSDSKTTVVQHLFDFHLHYIFSVWSVIKQNRVNIASYVVYQKSVWRFFCFFVWRFYANQTQKQVCDQTNKVFENAQKSVWSDKKTKKLVVWMVLKIYKKMLLSIPTKPSSFYAFNYPQTQPWSS